MTIAEHLVDIVADFASHSEEYDPVPSFHLMVARRLFLQYWSKTLCKYHIYVVSLLLKFRNTELTTASRRNLKSQHNLLTHIFC